jgi:hypothetical protein
VSCNVIPGCLFLQLCLEFFQCRMCEYQEVDVLEIPGESEHLPHMFISEAACDGTLNEDGVKIIPRVCS